MISSVNISKRCHPFTQENATYHSHNLQVKNISWVERIIALSVAHLLKDHVDTGTLANEDGLGTRDWRLARMPCQRAYLHWPRGDLVGLV